MFNKLHEWLLALPEHYPELIDYTMIDTFFSAARAKIFGLWWICGEIVDYLINEPCITGYLCIFSAINDVLYVERQNWTSFWSESLFT